MENKLDQPLSYLGQRRQEGVAFLVASTSLSGYNGKRRYGDVPSGAGITQPFLTFRKAQFMDLALKKQALRMLTYGLYVVMCNDGGEVNAFTANWLTQVSFDPPLLAVSVENNTKSLPMILRSRQFTVNVLHAGQRDLAGKLGKSALKSPDKMQGIQYSIEPEGFPILSVALSWIA